MDLSARKYHFIEGMMTIENERVMDALENVLKQEIEAQQPIHSNQNKELEKRLKYFAENPGGLLDWQEVRK